MKANSWFSCNAREFKYGSIRLYLVWCCDVRAQRHYPGVTAKEAGRLTSEALMSCAALSRPR